VRRFFLSGARPHVESSSDLVTRSIEVVPRKRHCLSLFTVALLASSGCGRIPSPLTPELSGSIGLPHRGVLTEGVTLPAAGSCRYLRDDDHHFGIPRFVAAIERAAEAVEHEKPGSLLVVGDLSAKGGGRLMPHLSHRSGRDADLLLYWTTLEGAPVPTPAFLRVGHDGLAWDAEHRRFLRFDVEREWLLVKALVTDPEARVQWIFAHHTIEAWLVEWARARGEDADTILRAEEVLAQPHPGGLHDDHVHVRTACSSEEMAHGCEPSGPVRAWIPGREETLDAPPSLEDLVRELARPARDESLVSTMGGRD
jgi:penicillin-insensitive murein endopeptidase